MKLTIKTTIKPVEVLGKLVTEEHFIKNESREVYIDNKRCPDALAEIILLGLDVSTSAYMSRLKEQWSRKAMFSSKYKLKKILASLKLVFKGLFRTMVYQYKYSAPVTKNIVRVSDNAKMEDFLGARTPWFLGTFVPFYKKQAAFPTYQAKVRRYKKKRFSKKASWEFDGYIDTNQ